MCFGHSLGCPARKSILKSVSKYVIEKPDCISGGHESAIVGKPLLLLSDGRSHLTQEGTLHFRHLLIEGLVHRVTSEAERSLHSRIRASSGLDVKPASVGLRALDALCDRLK